MTVDQRIVVSDFDAVHQADVWRRLGAQQAIVRLVSALRTAILLGDVLTIDRNQLFDGIFFLSLGPHGIAAALGLAMHDPLPIVVSCEDGSLSDGDATSQDGVVSDDGIFKIHERRVPVLRGYTTSDQQISVDLQLDRVRSPRFRETSSALMAVRGDDVPNGWICAPPADSWLPGCGLTRFAAPVNDAAKVIELIEASQDAWAEAIWDGRVAVESWTPDPEAGPLDVIGALRSARETLLAQDIAVTALGEYVFALDYQRRGEAVRDIAKWIAEHPGEADFDEARFAMEAWSRAYYRAIAERSGNLYLSFFDSEVHSRYAESYGLVLATRSRYERLKDKVFNPDQGTTLRVEGEILDRMAQIPPVNFAQLYMHTRDTARDLISTQRPQAMYDLAYAAREAVNEPETHYVKRRQTIRRVVTTTTLAVAITVLGLLTDLGSLSTAGQTFAVIIAALLGVLASLPWDDMIEFFRLRRTSMTATLTLSDRG